MNTRSLTSPSVFGQWPRPRYLDTLDPRLWICPNIGSRSDYHTLVFNFAFDFLVLCFLGSGIPHKSSLLGVGFALDTQAPCTLFSGFTHESRQSPIIKHSALAIDTWAPVARMPSFGQETKSAMVSTLVTIKLGKHGLAHFFVKVLVHGQT